MTDILLSTQKDFLNLLLLIIRPPYLKSKPVIHIVMTPVLSFSEFKFFCLSQFKQKITPSPSNQHPTDHVASQVRTKAQHKTHVYRHIPAFHKGVWRDSL